MTNVTKLQVPADPFDPENLRLDQSFAETAGVKKLLTTVPVRKPNPSRTSCACIRTRPIVSPRQSSS